MGGTEPGLILTAGHVFLDIYGETCQSNICAKYIPYKVNQTLTNYYFIFNFKKSSSTQTWTLWTDSLGNKYVVLPYSKNDVYKSTKVVAVNYDPSTTSWADYAVLATSSSLIGHGPLRIYRNDGLGINYSASGSMIESFGYPEGLPLKVDYPVKQQYDGQLFSTLNAVQIKFLETFHGASGGPQVALANNGYYYAASLLAGSPAGINDYYCNGATQCINVTVFGIDSQVPPPDAYAQITALSQIEAAVPKLPWEDAAGWNSKYPTLPVSGVLGTPPKVVGGTATVPPPSPPPPAPNENDYITIRCVREHSDWAIYLANKNPSNSISVEMMYMRLCKADGSLGIYVGDSRYINCANAHAVVNNINVPYGEETYYYADAFKFDPLWTLAGYEEYTTVPICAARTDVTSPGVAWCAAYQSMDLVIWVNNTTRVVLHVDLINSAGSRIQRLMLGSSSNGNLSPHLGK